MPTGTFGILILPLPCLFKFCDGTALSLVISKTSSFGKTCAHIKVSLALEIEMELPDGTTSTANTFSSILSTMFQFWIANSKFHVYTKQPHIIDLFVAGFKAPNGDMVDNVKYKEMVLLTSPA